MITDRLQRPLRDLRISVTDRCNFRCTYCMPRDVFGRDFAFAPRHELLTFEEIARLATVFARLGVRKLRLTGGEPLLRRDIEHLVGMLHAIAGIDDLSMTTNGSLLADKAQVLRAAGLQRITVSLDALDDATFRSISDVDLPIERVLDGLSAARHAGFAPIKLNAVVKRGVNENAVVELARFGREQGYIVRFIEYMDVGTTNGWRLAEVVPAAEIVGRVHAVFPLEPAGRSRPDEVAERWRYRDGRGEIGVIGSVTRPFCGACARARLSPCGELYTCLFASGARDLRGPLRSGASDQELEELIAGTWRARTDRYSELRSDATVHGPRVEMSYIGG